MSPSSFSSSLKSHFLPTFFILTFPQFLHPFFFYPYTVFFLVLTLFSLASAGLMPVPPPPSIPALHLLIRPSLSCSSRLSKELSLVSLKRFSSNLKAFTSQSWVLPPTIWAKKQSHVEALMTALYFKCYSCTRKWHFLLMILMKSVWKQPDIHINSIHRNLYLL